MMFIYKLKSFTCMGNIQFVVYISMHTSTYSSMHPLTAPDRSIGYYSIHKEGEVVKVRSMTCISTSTKHNITTYTIHIAYQYSDIHTISNVYILPVQWPQVSSQSVPHRPSAYPPPPLNYLSAHYI